GMTYGSPEGRSFLGYDYIGHDVWSRVLAGGASIIWMTLAASLVALVIGSSLGILAAFARNKIDQFVTWLTDVFMAFPDLILVLLIVSMLGRQPWLIVLTVSIAFIPGVIRLARSVALNLVEQEYIEAARILGYSKTYILFREILPNMLTPLLIHLGVMLTWAVGMLSGLAFLGYGVAPPAADWGLMINENRAGLLVQPWAVFAPVILIALFALGTNVLAEGVGRAAARIEEK
ncbi:MAG: ABC transporter permease, partial [Acinetobacter calcoaceticus]